MQRGSITPAGRSVGPRSPLEGFNAAIARGLAMATWGRMGEAAVAFESAVRINPAAFEGWTNLGNALRLLGRLDEAVTTLREAVRLRPVARDAVDNLGIALAAVDRFNEATECHRETIRLDPLEAQGHHHLGTSLLGAGRREEALASFREALRLHPGHAQALNFLGVTLRELGEFDDSLLALRESLRIDPRRHETMNNLGLTLRERGDLDEAAGAFRMAIALAPDHWAAWNNAGIVSTQLGAFDEAIAQLDRALALRAADPEVRQNRASALLAMGDYERGFTEYEWRIDCPRSSCRRPPKPTWDGSDLEGKTILLHTEQGLGDTLQFVRFAEAARLRGGRVLVSCQPALVGLLSLCPFVDRAVDRDESPPSYDFQAPLMSLPRVLGTTLATVPTGVPYLFAEPGAARSRGLEFGDDGELKVGICWQGNSAFPGDRHRSIPLARFEPLGEIPGVRLIVVQRGAGLAQLDGWRGSPLVRPGHDSPDAPWTYEDTAAVVANLDLMVSSDTSVAHLAGAMGVPTWLALGSSPDWRWLRDRDDSPWYPTMRLFRQDRRGDWEGVFGRIAEELSRRAGGGRG